MTRLLTRLTFIHAMLAASAVAALLPGRPAHADALTNIQKAGLIRVKPFRMTSRRSARWAQT